MERGNRAVESEKYLQKSFIYWKIRKEISKHLNVKKLLQACTDIIMITGYRGH